MRLVIIGILGNNERDHTWMDEGLNTFMNIRYWHKKYGSEAPYVVNEFAQEKLGPFSIGKNLKYGTFEYFGYVPWVRLGDEEPLALSSNDFQRRANYGLSYSKAGIYSWHLLHYLVRLRLSADRNQRKPQASFLPLIFHLL